LISAPWNFKNLFPFEAFSKVKLARASFEFFCGKRAKVKELARGSEKEKEKEKVFCCELGILFCLKV
jgi:hypothetical protein